MKKFLPIIIFVLGALVLVGAFLFIRSRRAGTSEEEDAIIEIPLNERPVVSLTPSADGHWLIFKVDRIVVKAKSLDYELLYMVSDGRTQGVSGVIALDGQKSFEKNLLLGSESSGKFRYDEGVEEGTLTLRFRNDKGKLIGKLATQFLLQFGIKKLTSLDDKFSYEFDKAPKEDFFVIMQTFGLPKELGSEAINEPYGVFSSSTNSLPGKVQLESGAVYLWTASDWKKLEGNKSPNIGIFVGTN